MSAQVERPPVTDLVSAYDEIPYVETPADAEKLIGTIEALHDLLRVEKLSEEQERAWKVVRLKAERRYGIVLGEAASVPGTGRGNKKSVSGTNAFTGAERTACNQARRVAAIAQDEFDDYVRKAKSPSRAGLLRKPRHPVGSELHKDEKVIAWVAKRRKVGRSRDQLSQEADEQAYGWPVPGKSLGRNQYDRIMAILKEREARPPGRPRNWNGKSNDMRLREIRQNDLGKLNRLAMDINRLCRILEDYRPDDYTPDEDSVWHIAAIYEDLISLSEWVSRSFSATQGWLGDADVRKKIERLRDISGRTPEEAETAQRLADLLERKLGARLTVGFPTEPSTVTKL